MQRILLAAAHRDLVGNLVAAVRGAGLTVAAVDLVPLALIRAIGRRVSDNGGGAEAIVSIGGGVTVIVVHEAGLPRFVRVLGLGGRLLTEAIARDLNIPFDQAEALKRQTGQVPDHVADRARTAMARPLADLVEQMRGSLDYYRAQPGAPRLLRVTLTGGASLVPGLAEQLARPHRSAGRVGDAASSSRSATSGSRPSGSTTSTRTSRRRPASRSAGSPPGVASTLSGEGSAAADRQPTILIAVVVGVLLVLVLGGIWWMRKSVLDTEKDRLARPRPRPRRCSKEQESLSAASATQTQIDTLQGQVETVLATDISWARMLQEIARTIPNDTWLTAFQGTSSNEPGSSSSGASTLTPSPTTTPTTAAGASGAHPSRRPRRRAAAAAATRVGRWRRRRRPPRRQPVAPRRSRSSVSTSAPSPAWIQRIGTQIPSFSDLWVPNASRGGQTSAGSGRDFVNFTSTANITAAARSDRLDKAKRAAK